VDNAVFVKTDWWHRTSEVNKEGHPVTECGQVIEHPEALAGRIDTIEQDNGCPLCVPEKAMPSELAKIGKEPEAEAVPVPIEGPAPKLTAPRIVPPEATPVVGDQPEPAPVVGDQPEPAPVPVQERATLAVEAKSPGKSFPSNP
jgi:hypothetical protein